MLARSIIDGHDVTSLENEDCITMTKTMELTFEQVSAALSYDPETGKIVWRVAASRRIKAGDEAGIYKKTHARGGDGPGYRYIGFMGTQTPAARIAWLLHYGEWPGTNINYKNDDPTDLRIENLVLARFPTIRSTQGERRVYTMSKEAARHYGLKRYYGMTGEEYGEMLAAQHGLCAICNKPETAMFNDAPKAMHVDHCHATNQIRALLCGACNGMLGLAKDNPETLRSAADYIEKHAALESRIIPFAAREDPE